eukprot:6200817-Pleurochrysis_carterae.AAC.1
MPSLQGGGKLSFLGAKPVIGHMFKEAGSLTFNCQLLDLGVRKLAHCSSGRASGMQTSYRICSAKSRRQSTIVDKVPGSAIKIEEGSKLYSTFYTLKGQQLSAPWRSTRTQRQSSRFYSCTNAYIVIATIIKEKAIPAAAALLAALSTFASAQADKKRQRTFDAPPALPSCDELPQRAGTADSGRAPAPLTRNSRLIQANVPLKYSLHPSTPAPSALHVFRDHSARRSPLAIMEARALL